MIYLIGKIFIYLLLALGLGAVAGWLWRNLQGAGRESEMERAVMDARGRLPQMETALRARDQSFEALRLEYNAREEELAAQAEILAARDRSITELERACAQLRAQLEAAAPAATPEARSDETLVLHPGDPESAERAAAGDPQVAARREPDEVRQEPAEAQRELEEALAASRSELERLQRAFATEQRRVAELTQERELQRRSLQALEQQLELAREVQPPRSASG